MNKSESSLLGKLVKFTKIAQISGQVGRLGKLDNHAKRDQKLLLDGMNNSGWSIKI